MRYFAVFIAICILYVATDFLDYPSLYRHLHGKPDVTHKTGIHCTPGGIVAGAIRNDGAGWRVISDEAHRPVNISAVETSYSSITVHLAFTAEAIHTFVVSPDETLSINGYSAGARVALDKVIIPIARDDLIGRHIVAPHSVDLPFSNLWIYGVFSAEC